MVPGTARQDRLLAVGVADFSECMRRWGGWYRGFRRTAVLGVADSAVRGIRGEALVVHTHGEEDSDDDDDDDDDDDNDGGGGASGGGGGGGGAGGGGGEGGGGGGRRWMAGDDADDGVHTVVTAARLCSMLQGALPLVRASQLAQAKGAKGAAKGAVKGAGGAGGVGGASGAGGAAGLTSSGWRDAVLVFLGRAAPDPDLDD
jgi:hypothetical protein